jgi:F-type H+-transporting ATPase subunit gamma
MPNPRLLDKRRKSIRNIRKITRTMELIATARFKKAMDRAWAASAYTDRMTKLVRDLLASGLEVSHPLLEPRQATQSVTLLVLTSNRGLCGGFNGNVQRTAYERWRQWREKVPECRLEVSGKRGIGAFKFRGVKADVSFTHFEDKPAFDEVDVLASRYLDDYVLGNLDRLEIVYMKFESASRQYVAVETLLPLSAIVEEPQAEDEGKSISPARVRDIYQFIPSPQGILDQIVPTSFKIRLFKCFLDSAVSEQIARMVAMKSATENADDLTRRLSMRYNRARQGRITSELMDVIGGVEALS